MSVARERSSIHAFLQSQAPVGWKGKILQGIKRQDSENEWLDASWNAPEARDAKAEWKSLAHVYPIDNSVLQSSKIAQVHATLQQKGMQPSKARIHRNLVRACEILYG
jgi:hypothetical protein